jgi:hypothetical protein
LPIVLAGSEPDPEVSVIPADEDIGTKATLRGGICVSYFLGLLFL